MASLPPTLALSRVDLAGPALRPTGDDTRSAAAKFEGLVFGELMKAMRATVMRDEEDESFGLDVSQSMFDEAIADASAGRLGLERMLARELGGEQAPPSIASTTALPHTHRGAVAAYRSAALAIGRPHANPRPRHGTFDWALPKAGELPTRGIVSSRYGWRQHPTEHTKSFHEGLDIAADEGTEITAVQAGKVRFAGKRGSFGNLVELEHVDGSVTRYAHASRLFVRRGDSVEVGETIADVGSTGRATGPHLHFEALVDGKAVDPERYLDKLRTRADKLTEQP